MSSLNLKELRDLCESKTKVSLALMDAVFDKAIGESQPDSAGDFEGKKETNSPDYDFLQHIASLGHLSQLP